MFKHLSICATLLAAAMGPANAQQQEAVLQRIATSGADFDIVLAMPKSPPQWMDDLNMSPDALIVHLIGGELVLAFDDADKMLKAAESLRLPVSASHWVRKDGKLRTPFVVYVVPKAE